MAGEAAHHATTHLCASSRIGIGKQCQHSGGPTSSPLSFVFFAHKYVIKYHSSEPLPRYFHWRIILPHDDRSKGNYKAGIVFTILGGGRTPRVRLVSDLLRVM